MELQKAKELCEQLMEKNGVGKAWKFKWINCYNIYGRCSWRNKIISLSKRFVEVNNESEVTNTILHEIAHARCRKHGHNKYWKAWCVKLGARPERINTIANRPPRK